MRLREFLDPSAVSLSLSGDGPQPVLTELVALLSLDARASATVVRQLLRREAMGPTAFGRGVAIPHCRTLAVTRLRVAFGLHPAGVSFGAADSGLVHAFFLIVAPPMEVSNQYLPVLGRIAQLLHDREALERLRSLRSPDELFALLDRFGV